MLPTKVVKHASSMLQVNQNKIFYYMNSTLMATNLRHVIVKQYKRRKGEKTKEEKR